MSPVFPIVVFVAVCCVMVLIGYYASVGRAKPTAEILLCEGCYKSFERYGGLWNMWCHSCQDRLNKQLYRTGAWRSYFGDDADGGQGPSTMLHSGDIVQSQKRADKEPKP